MVGSFATDEYPTRALAAQLVICNRDLEGRIDRLRTGVREEDAVKAGRREFGDPLRDLEVDHQPGQERG